MFFGMHRKSIVLDFDRPKTVQTDMLDFIDFMNTFIVWKIIVYLNQ